MRQYKEPNGDRQRRVFRIWFGTISLVCNLHAVDGSCVDKICMFGSPGRFFAAVMLKSMLAHIVLTYDVKLDENGTPPRSQHIGTSIQLNPSATIMFRKRKN